MSGSGGTLFLRARSMNVGNDRVRANADTRGGDGRIRLSLSRPSTAAKGEVEAHTRGFWKTPWDSIPVEVHQVDGLGRAQATNLS